ncbi:MAG: HNH endonuclease [Planctomycetota bacterium]
MTNIDLSRVLVLNKAWQPIATVVLRNALTLAFRGRARVVCADTFQLYNWEEWLADRAVNSSAHVIEDDYIRTVGMFIRLPEVVTLSKFAGFPNRGVPYSRRGIFERDNGQCQYCGIFVRRNDRTIDHVVPQSRGGRNSWDNCVLACGKCNHRKADKLVIEAGMVLATCPKQPKREDMLLHGVTMLPAWKSFFGPAKTAAKVTQ